jgi:hypothetical protein
MELMGANLLPLGAGLYLVHLRKRMDFGELRNGCVPDVLCCISYLTFPSWVAHSKSKMHHNMHIFAGFLNCTQQILVTPYFCTREHTNRKRERREWGGRERGRVRAALLDCTSNQNKYIHKFITLGFKA